MDERRQGQDERRDWRDKPVEGEGDKDLKEGGIDGAKRREGVRPRQGGAVEGG
jgi:hypothetical protein